MAKSFTELFVAATTSESHKDGFQPRSWQSRLAEGSTLSDRLIRIPTGEGKTLAALLTWVFHRINNDDRSWPTRLVWCLPMRTLVEQTQSEAEKLLKALGLSDEVDVRTAMGGVDEQRWYENPKKPTIIVGTQDMLLSRALNRGYAMGRAAWPRAYGLLNNDCLWIMDEIQLMGIGLTTSAQIQAFWRDEQNKETLGLSRRTWWMSATLQPAWLESPETASFIDELKENMLVVEEGDRTGAQWKVAKTIHLEQSSPDGWADLIVERHQQHSPDPKTGRQTLVVVNTVKQAVELHKKVKAHFKKVDDNQEIRLIHSRFRPAEREDWVEQFLSRSSLTSETNRIMIATQVVEAGVDISASCLVTELAPWPSLVQRFGRAARYGGRAEVVVLDQQHQDDKKALPYTIGELDSSRVALKQLDGVSLTDLEAFEKQCTAETLTALYPFSPVHVLLREEFDELFDTSADLSGADLDISRFVREGEDRNVQIFWRAWEGKAPDDKVKPVRRELCPVSVAEAKKWLGSKKIQYDQRFEWDYLDGRWNRLDINSIRPGQIILVPSNAGGYDKNLGFTGDKSSVEPVADQPAIQLAGDYADPSEAGSEVDVWKTISTHCHEAALLAANLCGDNGFDLSDSIASVVLLAMRLHDWGKAHPAFASGTYRVEPMRTDLAKAPNKAWRSMSQLYRTQSHGPRLGFRHELASALSILALLKKCNPDHPAILGRYREMLEACGATVDLKPDSSIANSIADELKTLSELQFNLLLYLVAAHHGKVRCSLQASPVDQEFPVDSQNDFVGTGMPIRGVRESDTMPEVSLPDANGDPVMMPALPLSLQPASIGLSVEFGASWTERVQQLMTAFGPFTMGWLEAVIRAIDGDASNDQKSPGKDDDPLIESGSLSVADLVTDAKSMNEQDDVKASQNLEATNV